MSLKLYYDFMSQPSRAVYILMKACNVPFQNCPVALRKGEHLTEAFKKDVSRFHLVPVLHDNDFKLTESIAILRYLANENYSIDKLYPATSKEQARVDEYLEWQHNNTRAFCGMYFKLKWLMPLLTGKQTPEEELKKLFRDMEKGLDSIQTLWLSSSPYIVGDKISVADIWAACEVEQPRVTGYNPIEGRPILAAWLERVRKELGQDYQDAHVYINKIAAAANKTKK